MKTIFVVYGSDVSRAANDCKTKRYAFNTEADVKVGEVLRAKEYSSDMVVKEVLDKSFKYYNNINGDLSNELTSTSFRAVKNLKVVDNADNDVIATRVNEEAD